MGQIEQIVVELAEAAVAISRLVEEGERQEEIRRREWEEERRRVAEEHERARRVKARKDARQDLLQVISAWAEVKRIHAFFAEAEAESERLEHAGREKLLQRLALARTLIGDQSALESLLAWKAPDER